MNRSVFDIKLCDVSQADTHERSFQCQTSDIQDNDNPEYQLRTDFSIFYQQPISLPNSEQRHGNRYL